MLKKLTRQQNDRIDKLLNGMSLQEKIGQTLCPVAWNFGETPTEKNIGQIIDKAKRLIDRYHVGSFFEAHGTAVLSRKLEKALLHHGRTPTIINADMEYGAGCRFSDRVHFPFTMACGAADSVKLVEKMAEATAIESRAGGVHWTLGPVVDLCLNPNNSMIYCRSFGSRPAHVERMGRAFIRACQKNGYMAATAKHFPGDGCDEREPHMCTSVISLDRKGYMDTYGRVWKAMIDEGTMCIMTGHIGLPFVDPARDWRGPTPATLSKAIQLDFLRDELGFQGLIISDAVIMTGFAAHVPYADRAWRNIEAGPDVNLFSNVETDAVAMLEAVRQGRMSEERIEFAARRMLELKTRVGLFDGLTVKDPPAATVKEYRRVSAEIARRSVKIVRDGTGILPLKLEKGAKVLTISMTHVTGLRHGGHDDLVVVDEELRRRGFVVDHLINQGGDDVRKIMGDYAAIFVNVNIPPRYGSNKLAPPASGVLWDSFWPDHPRVVFTSFTDPFKLHEMPCVPNWVLTFCNTADSQRAAVAVWLGEEKARGKLPVSLPGYFEAEVK